MRTPVFRPVGEQGLLVEFGDEISADIHARVLALDRSLNASPFAGFREAAPAYAALLILFDPLVTDHATVRRAVEALLHAPASPLAPSALREVAICYDEDFAPDLAAVARHGGMTREQVIAAHLAGEYCVFMYGFAPGYAYLAGVPEALRMPRKPVAVRGIAAGSVVIAGPQCLVTTLTMPTGWWIIGRSPTAILTGDPAAPFLFDVGDRVRFRRTSRSEYEDMK